MASSRIHLFKNLAIAAGSPNNYYLNPSENLWKIASKWSVVEHKDVLDLTINMLGFAEPGFDMEKVCAVVISVEENFIDINVGEEYKPMPPGYADKDGMKNFSFEMNPKFLNLAVTDDPSVKMSDGFKRLFISKLKLNN